MNKCQYCGKIPIFAVPTTREVIYDDSLFDYQQVCLHLSPLTPSLRQRPPGSPPRGLHPLDSRRAKLPAPRGVFDLKPTMPAGLDHLVVFDTLMWFYTSHRLWWKISLRYRARGWNGQRKSSRHRFQVWKHLNISEINLILVVLAKIWIFVSRITYIFYWHLSPL